MKKGEPMARLLVDMRGALAGGRRFFFLRLGMHQQGRCTVVHGFFVDHDFLDIIHAGQLEHGVQQDAFHDRTQTPRAGFALDRAFGDGGQSIRREGQLGAFDVEQALVLLDQSVLRLGQNGDQRGFVEICQGGDHRQTANKFRDQTEFQQIFRLKFLEQLARAAFFRVFHRSTKADGRAFAALRDDFL